MTRGESVASLLGVIFSEIRTSYYAWQGTWSSLFLFHLQPGIYGERWYTLTTWIALACIMGGMAVFLREVLCRQMKLSRPVLYTVFSLVSLVSVQYMPKIRGGLFWYTSIAHYIIPYGFSLLAMSLSLRFLAEGKGRWLLIITLICAYLGGAGYPEIVLTMVWLFFLIMLELSGVTKLASGKGNTRILLLLIPLFLEAAGFMVSAAAPGNSVRGGADFGFSLARVFTTIYGAIRMGVSESLQYFTSCPLLIVMIVMTGAMAWADCDPEATVGASGQSDESYPESGRRHFAVVAVLGFLLICAVRAPEVYAGVDVSGGVPDTYFLVSVLYLASLSAGLGRLAGTRFCADGRTRPAFLITSLLCVLVMLAGAKAIVKNSNDYICIDYVRSGQMADFSRQMEERLKILEDDSVKDVVLLEMNDEQGPFMHMPLMRDPQAFTNRVTAEYYGKSSVIAVPREDYEKLQRVIEDGESDAAGFSALQK